MNVRSNRHRFERQGSRSSTLEILLLVMGDVTTPLRRYGTGEGGVCLWGLGWRIAQRAFRPASPSCARQTARVERQITSACVTVRSGAERTMVRSVPGLSSRKAPFNLR